MFIMCPDPGESVAHVVVLTNGVDPSHDAAIIAIADLAGLGRWRTVMSSS
jgi:hypothetical protein